MKPTSILHVLLLLSLLMSLPTLLLGQKDETHQVREGETLTKIARDYQTTVKDLKDFNGLNSDLIFVGQTLVIPNFSFKPDPTITPLPRRQPSRDDEWGEMHLNMLFEGEKPDYGSSGSNSRTDDPKEEPRVIIFSNNRNKDNVWHRVQPGEDMYQIATKYGVRVDELIIRNARKRVKPGDVLLIPEVSSPYLSEEPIEEPIVEDLLSKKPSASRPGTTWQPKATEPRHPDLPPNQYRVEKGTYFRIQGSGLESPYYAWHAKQQPGEMIKIALPDNAGFIEVVVNGRLGRHSEEIIGLSAEVVDILEAAGSNGQVTIYYE